MAFLIFYQKGKELGRWQLGRPVVIGRASDCQIAVHDILLSRHHCRIERTGSGWTAIDLSSKNGTWIENERITRRGLRDGDVLTMGKTTTRFMMGRLAADSPGMERLTGQRPADPFEALSGTISEFDAQAVVELQRKGKFPTPQPVPREPAAYVRDDVYSMLNEIASSSWDSIYESAARPRRALPSDPMDSIGGVAVVAPPRARRPMRPIVMVDSPAQTATAAPTRVRPSLQRTEAAPAPTRRPLRPTVLPKPTPAPQRRWSRRLVHGLEAVRRWVAPVGAVLML